jgi:putative protease
MEMRVGQITHYYARISVAVVDLEAELKLGDWITILGHTTEFSQRVDSMEVEHHKIESAGEGETIALKVQDYVRKGDLLYKQAANTS